MPCSWKWGRVSRVGWDLRLTKFLANANLIGDALYFKQLWKRNQNNFVTLNEASIQVLHKDKTIHLSIKTIISTQLLLLIHNLLSISSSISSKPSKVIRKGTMSRIRFLYVQIFTLNKLFRPCLGFKSFLRFGPEFADSFRIFILSDAFLLSPTSLAFLKLWNSKRQC